MKLKLAAHCLRPWIHLSIQSKLLLIVSGAFLLTGGFTLLHDYQQRQQNLQQLFLGKSQAIFEQVQITRHWNAEQGGVYALLKPGDQPNPYLFQVGPAHGSSTIEPEILDVQGRRWRLVNPALMTRELSELTQQKSDLRYKITSKRLINPQNKPDQFEDAALSAFEAGRAFEFQYQQIDGRTWFRYMAPLKITENCLKCHGFQGYQVGDVRGGISVSFPVQQNLESDKLIWQKTSAGFLLGYLLIVAGVLFALQRYFVSPIRQLSQLSGQIGGGHLIGQHLVDSDDEVGRLTHKLIEVDQVLYQQRLLHQQLLTEAEQSARRDPLTQCWNRRYLHEVADELYSEQRELCSLMFDIDHFKQINDQYGHTAGDEVLQLFCEQIRQLTRSDDLLVRLGGEEFLLIMPNTHHEEGWRTAERIRSHIEAFTVSLAGVEPFHFTVSIGLYCSQKATLSAALAEADRLMYLAKSGGRNQVVG